MIQVHLASDRPTALDGRNAPSKESAFSIGAVYLAAGNSLRFGSNKLLYPINGKPMFAHGLSILDRMVRKGVLDRLAVVSQYPEIMQYTASCGYTAVFNPDSGRGISSSIFLGLSQLSGTTDACLFLVADQPYITEISVSSLVSGWAASGKGIGCLSFQGEPGNPVLFSSRYYPELFSLKGDVGGKKIVKKYLDDVFFLELEHERELEDMDTLTKAAT